MLEFIQLMGLKRILFLVGLILYVVVIFIILCLPEKRNSPQEPDELVNNDEDALPTPQDAHYCTLSESAHSPSLEFKSAGSFNRFRRKKSRPTDPWEL